MTTYKELVNMVLDELKLISDDSIFQPEHVLFLLDKYRSFILKQRYSDIRKEIPESNYQTVCVDLEQTTGFEGDNCGAGYLRSTKKIPPMLSIGNQSITGADFFQGDITYVTNKRFKYTGNNRYLPNAIYGTIGPDEYLYIKSNNPQAYHLCKAKVTGIFEDSAKASELSCDGEDTQCDVMDRNYPLEEALIPPVIELIIKELGGQKYQAEDKQNDAADNLSDIATYIKQQLALGRRSDIYKQY